VEQVDRQGSAELTRQASDLTSLNEIIVSCRMCPRLVEWRESVARAAPASHAAERYWAKPLPGLGDPSARLVIVGLAPAAHGGNRTGRMFTGDRSGTFLFAALHRAGFASQPTSEHRDDGLRLTGCYVTAVVRCAPPNNQPRPDERDRCISYLERELELLREARVVLTLGAFAYQSVFRLLAPDNRRPQFAHGTEVTLAANALSGVRTLLCSYHPSQRNVFTGLLTAEMFDAVLSTARQRSS
jgi:uracil-DNA glycosylase